jgi:hypothetical protein
MREFRKGGLDQVEGFGRQLLFAEVSESVELFIQRAARKKCVLRRHEVLLSDGAAYPLGQHGCASRVV